MRISDWSSDVCSSDLNLLFSGPPGSGKSLLASCLPGILPDLTPAEALEVSMVASVAGSLEGGKLLRARPYRAPHHSASMPALVGGGLKARPGEVGLAQLGVLFLDELPELDRKSTTRLNSSHYCAPRMPSSA